MRAHYATATLPSGDLGQMLWRAYAAKRVRVEDLVSHWGALANGASAVTGSLLLRFISENAQRYPEGRRDTHPRYAGAQPVGPLLLYGRAAQAHRHDPRFRLRLRAGHSSLPPLWQAGLLWVMAQELVLPPELLTDALLVELARGYFAVYRPPDPTGPPSWWGSPNPVPEARWAAALLSASSDARLHCQDPRVLLELVPHATPEQLVERMTRAASAAPTWAAVRALDVLEARHLPALERATLNLEVGPKPEYPWEAWPATLMLCTYLRLCERLGRPPASGLRSVARAALQAGGPLPVPDPMARRLHALAGSTP